MKSYNELGRKVLEQGHLIPNDRTGVGTLTLFGEQLKFDLMDGFPLVSGSKKAFRWIFEEQMAFLNGITSNTHFEKLGITIWDEWALKEDVEIKSLTGPQELIIKERGDLGPIYGAQWRNWEGHDGQRYDQIEALIDDLINRPYSRRLIVSAWNPAVLPDESKSHAENVIDGKQVLPPCHTFFQCHVRPATERDLTRFKEFFAKCGHELPEQMPDKVLDLQLYQRSADLVLGVPYNIAAYAFLNQLLAECVGMIPGVFTHTFGNVHIYQNHIEKFRDEQLTRELRELPLLAFDKIAPKIWETVYEDVRLVGYNPHPRLDYPVAV